jgi:SAM-dependent methyltransferase
MLRLARSRADDAHFGNVDYQVASIEHLPFADNSFDLVCSAGVIEYLRSCYRAIEEFQRVLKPGGVLVLPTTNMMAPAQLRRWLSPSGGFRLSRARWAFARQLPTGSISFRDSAARPLVRPDSGTRTLLYLTLPAAGQGVSGVLEKSGTAPRPGTCHPGKTLCRGGISRRKPIQS